MEVLWTKFDKLWGWSIAAGNVSFWILNDSKFRFLKNTIHNELEKLSQDGMKRSNLDE